MTPWMSKGKNLALETAEELQFLESLNPAYPSQIERWRNVTRESLKQPEFFDAIRKGLTLDFSNPFQSDLYFLYLTTGLSSSNFGGKYVTKAHLKEVLHFIETNNITETYPWMGFEIDFPEERRGKINVRYMHLEERAFRGCAGSDCSTNTRLTRGMEPHHVLFAIEKDGKSYGQVELVLGFDEFTGKDIAFLERYQIPRHLSVLHHAAIITALARSAAQQGYAFSSLIKLSHYQEFWGHPVGNFPGTEAQLQRALDKYFGRLLISNDFLLPFDSYAHRAEDFTYIAERIHHLGNAELYEIQDQRLVDREARFTPVLYKRVEAEFDFENLWKQTKRTFKERLEQLPSELLTREATAQWQPFIPLRGTVWESSLWREYLSLRSPMSCIGFL